MIAPLLLLLAVPDNACIAQQTALDISEAPKPQEASGPGLWIGGIAFERADIAAVNQIIDPQSQLPELEIAFSEAGNAKFIAAQHCGVGTPIEISYDGTVLSRPNLYERIVGGKAVISGGWKSVDEVNAFAIRLLGV